MERREEGREELEGRRGVCFVLARREGAFGGVICVTAAKAEATCEGNAGACSESRTYLARRFGG